MTRWVRLLRVALILGEPGPFVRLERNVDLRTDLWGSGYGCF
ncbi:MAG: hypothetical protein ACRYFU_11060 [Janthinobacterium lividum]